LATKDEAVAMVNKAVAFYKKEGADKAFAAFDKKPGDFTDRDLYVLVYSTSGKVLAHGSNVKLVGKDMSEATDVDGKPYVKERLALAAKQKTFWQDYKFTNPVSKKIEPRRLTATSKATPSFAPVSISNNETRRGRSRLRFFFCVCRLHR
jgi:signal transduction histidine kinase